MSQPRLINMISQKSMLKDQSSQDSIQQIDYKQVLTVGPFVFGDQEDWMDVFIESYVQQTCWQKFKSQIKRMTKKQLMLFQNKYGRYKKQPSKLMLTEGKFYNFFTQNLVSFLKEKRGKYYVQTMEDADFSYNSISNTILFDPSILCVMDFCNLAVLKLKGNKISSLEWVVRACNKFQSLLQLDLESNEIISLKPFNKGKFSQLRLLKLDINYLKDVDFIERCLIYGLESLKLNYNLMSNYMALYKCSFHLMDSFSMAHNVLKQNQDNRIRQNVLTKKFIKLKKQNR